MGEPDDRIEIADLVMEHLDAMRAGRWASALGMSSAELRARWSPEGLEDAAREGYVPLLASAGRRIDDITQDGDHAHCRLALTQPDGTTALAHYELRREHGAWRVAGVALGARLTVPASMNGGRTAHA